MTRISSIFFILVCMFTASLDAQELRSYVLPISWDRFEDAEPSPEFLLSSKLISNAGRYAFTWANNYYKSSATNDLFFIPNVNEEQAIRTHSSAALGLAMALRTGVQPQFGTQRLHDLHCSLAEVRIPDLFTCASSGSSNA